MSTNINSDLVKLPLSKAAERVKRCIAAHRPVFLHGPPGIGKSGVVYQIAVEEDRPLIDMRLPLYDPSDIKGIPFFNTVDKIMQWSVPGELPRAGRQRANDSAFHKVPDKNSLSRIATGEGVEISTPEQIVRMLDETNALLFLDELNAAPQSVQAAAYQLMLDRKIGEYTLPKNVAVVAAGNRSTDRAVVHKMATPLANRMAHIEVEPVFEDWVRWAGMVGIRSEVIGFLTSARQYWNTFGDKNNKDAIAFATPRSWDFISRTLRDGDDQDTAYEIASMYVGIGIGSTFAAYRQLALSVPDARKIYDGEKVDISKLDISILYTLAYNLLYGLRDMHTQFGAKDARVFKATDNTLKFAAHKMPPELAITMSRLMSAEFGIRINSKDTPAFDAEFWPAIKKYMGTK